MTKFILLDLFCGAGGCAKGYQLAGFYVIGVDTKLQPHYCGDEFYQENALIVLDILLAGGTWQGYRLSDFAAIHASPVCKGYSQANRIRQMTYPMLIEPTRNRLQKTGLPWILENVKLTGEWRGHMPASLELCGTMFGLKVYRHRYFESSHLLFAPCPCTHPRSLMDGYVCIFGDCIKGHQIGSRNNNYKRYNIAYGRAAMGIDWMTLKELSESVPPAYTKCIGDQIMPVLQVESAGVA